MKRLRRKLGLERCKYCGWRRIDWEVFGRVRGQVCAGPCTWETWEGLE